MSTQEIVLAVREEIREELSGVHVKLENMSDRLGKIEQTISAINERCPVQKQSIEKHNLDLYGPPGNGNNPGLMTRMKSLEDKISFFRSMGGAVGGVVGGVIAAVITAVIIGMLT